MARSTARRGWLSGACGQIVVGLAGGLALLLSACEPSGPSVHIHPARGPDVTVGVELATDPSSRSFGLMYRNELGADRGMLFVFPAAEPQSFWMKNTPLPLDILFIAEGGRIARIHARTTPYSETPLPSETPVRFVLEVNGGFTEQHGIREGDHVDLGALSQTPVR